jgi:hypothetical protein
MRIDGGCHCGFITYQGEADPTKAGICHCTDCQALTGTAYRVSVPVDGATFKLSGTPTVYVKTADSGNKREQAFCPRCGSPIYAASPGPEPRTYSIRLGTVRQRRELAPKLQIWTQSKLDWVDDLSRVPSAERKR